MNTEPLVGAPQEQNRPLFDIHKKLKEFNNGLSYAFPASPFHVGKNYILNATYLGNVEFSLYKRVGENFILIDFFTNLNSACAEAKEIIDTSGIDKKVFGSDDDANQTPEPNPNKPEKI